MKKNAKGLSVAVLMMSVLLFAGCGKKQKTTEEMVFQELEEKVETAMNSKKQESAVEFLEQLVTRFPEKSTVSKYKLMLSDLYLKAVSLEAAFELYRNFGTMYPGDKKAEYAMYKAILSKFYQTLKVNGMCDQSDAEVTLELCKQYLNNQLFAEHQEDVRDISYTCERRLIDKEVYVFNSYLRKKKFQSAENRVKYLRTTFLKNHKSLEPQILFLECKLAHRQKNEDLRKEKIETLMKDYNDSQFTRMAMGMVSKKNPITRFF